MTNDKYLSLPVVVATVLIVELVEPTGGGLSKVYNLVPPPHKFWVLSIVGFDTLSSWAVALDTLSSCCLTQAIIFVIIVKTS